MDAQWRVRARAEEGTVGAVTRVACQSIHYLGSAAVLVAALLIGPCICPPVWAQSSDWEPFPKAGNKPAKAAKPRAPPSPKTAAEPAGAKEPAQPQQAKLLDPAKVDPMEIDPAQIDLAKLDAKAPNSWIALGILEQRAGNFAGAKASLDQAMALGDQRGNRAAVAAAALFLGRSHVVSQAFLENEARGVATFGGRPDDKLTESVRREFESAKALFEKSLAIHKALDRKEGMAAAYARLGDLYSKTRDFEQAQAIIGEALALNKALDRKKQMAANYRDLAETHRYDLDQADALLKEAIALHEELGLKEELAIDYEKLATMSMKRGEPYEAERLYKLALSHAQKRGRISILGALERLYRDRNDPGIAAEMKEEAAALERERQLDGGGGTLIFSANLGLYVSGFSTKEQVESLEKALPLEKRLGNRMGLATSYLLLGLHYGLRSDIDEGRRAEFDAKAEAMLKDALVANKELAREEAMALVYRELAQVVDRRGKSDEVDAAIKEAEVLYKKLGNEEGMTRLYSSLGYGREKRGDKAQACAYWRRGAQANPDDKRLASILSSNKCATP
jgi:tetratricopeptide (TPR) repeat protein